MIMAWTTVAFGKYRGMSLPQIIFNDTDYFFWLCENNAFPSERLAAEAKEINHKARTIKIPSSYLNMKVQYTILNGFEHMTLVPVEQPNHTGSSRVIFRDCFDMSMARKFGAYAKKSNEILVQGIKRFLFGSENTRMTKKRCEQFFDDDSNFT